MNDPIQTLKSELVEKIHSFRTRSSQVEIDFDRFAYSEVTKWFDDQPNAPIHDIGRLMIDVMTKNFFMLRVFELKLEQVLVGIKFAATSDNPTVLIALTRSGVEHLSALAFQQVKFAALIDALAGQSSEKKSPRHSLPVCVPSSDCTAARAPRAPVRLSPRSPQ